MKPLFLILSVLFCVSANAQVAKDYTVAIKLTIEDAPLKFYLSWKRDTTVLQHKVFSKEQGQLFWTLRAELSKYDSSFTDTNVTVNHPVEYQVVTLKNTYNAYGYIMASKNLDAYNYRGKLLLLADSNYLIPLETEIKQLQEDLKADGWQVITRYVSRTSTPKAVKQHIHQLWDTDSASFKAVYLLGRIPVPYSGYIGPDAHSTHYGAWPADVYYSVVDSNQWTDYVLNVKVATDTRNHNVPNDGKFDADAIIPGSAKLQVGRVDMSNMPLFGNDTFLTKRYLEKAHNFKHNKYPVVLRALIDDNTGKSDGEAFARTGWANFPTMFGDSVKAGDYITDMKTNSYMFSYGSGGGSYTSCGGVAATTDFLTDSLTSPFTSYFGSYFGDWDNLHNFMRAGMASKSLILTSVWSGRPILYCHPMALGETAGNATLISVNSPRSLYYSMYYNNVVHFALLGDPTLRIHPITPATGISCQASCNNVVVNWTSSIDTGIIAHRVFRSATIDGAYEYIGQSTGNSFTDNNPLPGTNHYMVRAMRLQKTPSGTYYNMSLGITDSAVYTPVPKPVILVNDTLQCTGANEFVIKSGINNFPLPYTQNWFINDVPVTMQDSIVNSFLVGTYTVKAITSNNFGCTDSAAQRFFVSQTPSASILVSQEGQCLDSNKVLLTSVGNAFYAHRWIIGSDTLFGENQQKVLTTSGYHTVKLLVVNPFGNCSDETEQDSILIYAKPAPVAILGDPFMKLGKEYSFTAVGPGTSTYTWAVSQTPDFININNSSLTIRWDNSLLTATLKLVERSANGCKGDTVYFQVWTLVNSVHGIDIAINAYPNPVENELYISTDRLTENTVFAIFDVYGKKIITGKSTDKETKIDVSSLLPGIYYLDVSNDAQHAVIKIVKN